VIVLVGVDAGSSHTEALVADETVRSLARRRGHGAAVQPGQEQRAAAAVAEVVRDALAAAGVGLRADAVVIGAAGAGREAERSTLETALRAALGFPTKLRVTTDAAIALEAALRGRPGILLNAGSGSIAYARDASGLVWRAGGLGWQFGDDGSAYALVRAALGVVGRAADGRGPRTALSQRLAEAVGATTLDDMIRWTQTANRAAIAALAPHVCDAAAAGDVPAQRLLEQAAADLADHLAALLHRFPNTHQIPVALCGGLLSPASPVRALLADIARERMPSLTILEQRVDPPLGALALAVELVREAGVRD
jgi:N-acetylglucosamine kinase-like BadF-type ATPase